MIAKQSPAQDVSLSSNHKFPYRWNIKDGYPAKGIEYHGSTVMTTFACGGGSSMGYKLAGFNVVAANDIDPQMAKVYKANHNPKQFFLCGIEELLKRDDLPKVDVLDGSPPCSVFSMAGSREGAWQKDKMFREGQAKQILDDLFFDFIKLAEKVQPKVIIAENVKGMLAGHAKWYTREVVRKLNEIGYTTQVYLLNANTMGVPQRRQRVFFIANKTSKKIKLSFKEPFIPFKLIDNGLGKPLSETYLDMWDKTKPGFSFSEAHPKGSFFNTIKVHPNRVMPTITASSGGRMTHYKAPNEITNESIALSGSFPIDYNYMDIKPKYLIGMSVPPIMMAQVAHQVYEQLLKVI